MFSGAVLPFQITAAVFAVALVVSNAAVRKWSFAVLSVSAAVVLFCPACIGVGMIVEAVKYGRFEYADTSGMPAHRYVHLPPEAQNIVLHTSSARHEARFVISTPELEEWILETRSTQPELSEATAAPSDSDWSPKLAAGMRRYEAERFKNDFPLSGWSYEPGMREYTSDSPRTALAFRSGMSRAAGWLTSQRRTGDRCQQGAVSSHVRRSLWKNSDNAQPSRPLRFQGVRAGHPAAIPAEPVPPHVKSATIPP